MNESEFDLLADETMIAIEDAVEACEVDIDYDNAGGILTLEFANRSQIIINKQAPLKQIWVAARSRSAETSDRSHSRIVSLRHSRKQDRTLLRQE